MEAYRLDSSLTSKRQHVEGRQTDLWSATNFKAKNIACVVSKESSFAPVMLGLENLGFELACSSSLEETFRAVSEDPELWAMIIVRLDQSLDEERLENYVRLVRMMDVRVPIMVMIAHGKAPDSAAYPKLYADCVVGEPKSLEQLSEALKISVDANMRWGSRFDDYRREAIYRISRQY